MVEKLRSPAQRQRQDDNYRVNGKYAKVNPCNVCGKSAGVDYWSHYDTDGLINDELLVLCKRCSDKLNKFDGKTAIKMAEEIGKDIPDSDFYVEKKEVNGNVE